MRKYETKFKRKVVESFLAGEGGAKLLARRWSVPEEKIRTWVSHYRLHGVAGLQPKRSAYTADFKLQVLTHQDRERLSSRQVAAIYDIRNPNQVVVWRRAFEGGGVTAFVFNGEIVTFKIQERPLYSLVGNMLKKALSKLRRRSVAPLLHSDQGWHYLMPAYRKQLSAHGLKQACREKAIAWTMPPWRVSSARSSPSSSTSTNLLTSKI